MTNSNPNVLALDIGGTKIKAALINGHKVVKSYQTKTARNFDPIQELKSIAENIKNWHGQYHKVAAAVTGAVTREGYWRAFNSRTLNIENDIHLENTLFELFSVPSIAINDAQAAAWGEYIYGAGQNKNMIFLTLSTGLGGAMVLNGKLVTGHHGIAGHFGQMSPLIGDDNTPIENFTTGRFIGSQADQHHSLEKEKYDAIAVFEAAANNEQWAEDIIDLSARRAAKLCYNLQLSFDPEVFVLGGGIGLANGYRSRIEMQLEKHLDKMQNNFTKTLMPKIVSAQLGVDAGLIGVANLVNK